MAARKLYDLAVKVSEYQDNQGNKKGRWQNVGAVMQGDDGGKFIMLNRLFNPAGVPDLSGRGGESILLSMFEPNEQNGQQQGGGGGYQQQGGGQQQQRQAPQQQRSAPPQQSGYDEEVPF